MQILDGKLNFGSYEILADFSRVMLKLKLVTMANGVFCDMSDMGTGWENIEII